MQVVLSEWEKMEIFLHVVISNEEHFNNQVNKITYVDTSQLLSPDTPVTAQRLHDHKGDGSRDGDDA